MPASLRRTRSVSVVAYLAVAFGICLASLGTLLALDARNSFANERRHAFAEAKRAASIVANGMSAELSTAAPSLQPVLDKSSDPDRCSLLNLVEALDGQATVVRPDGSIVCTSWPGYRQSDARPYADALWLREALHNNDYVTTFDRPSRDPVMGVYAYVFARAFKAGGGRTAVLAGIFATSSTTVFDNKDTLLGSDVVVLDPTRSVILARSAGGLAWAGRPLLARDLASSFRTPRSARDPEGVERIYGEARTTPGRWIVLAGLPLRKALASAYAEFRENVTFGVVIVLIVMFLGTLLYRKIGRPMRSFRSAIERAGATPDGRLDHVRGPTELLTTAEAFNRTMEARRRTEERFSSLVRHASDPILVLDSSWRVTWSSPAASNVFGMIEPNQSLFDAVHPEDRVSLAGTLSALEPAETSAIEFRAQGPGDGVRHVDAVIDDLREDVAVGGVVLVAHDITERKAFEDHLAHQAAHDPLTGLPNRTLVLERLRNVREHAAVLFLDLDRFKLVNDAHGHPAGDRVLVELGARLAQKMRPGDLVGRFGGDEFVAVCSGTTKQSHALALARRLAHALDEPFFVEGQTLFLSGSVGVAISGHGESAEDLLRNADAAMYQAKQRGRAAVALFDDQMRAAAVDRLEIESALHAAIDNNELVVHYQPKVHLADGSLAGVEALVRWNRPGIGMVPPDTFIGVAEDSGLIVPLGKWVLEEACRTAVVLGSQSGRAVPVAVNISAKQLASDEIVLDVHGTLQRTGLDPSLLTLEVTESLVLDDTQRTAATLSSLRALGVRISIDDFGTGQTALGHLHRFPIDELKIDRSFVARLTSDDQTRTIVRAIIGLAKSLHVHTVAEGVETAAQLAELRSIGCDAGQGYYFSRPVPAADVLSGIAPWARSAV